jgi:hypothetical protein
VVDHAVDASLLGDASVTSEAVAIYALASSPTGDATLGVVDPTIQWALGSSLAGDATLGVVDPTVQWALNASLDGSADVLIIQNFHAVDATLSGDAALTASLTAQWALGTLSLDAGATLGVVDPTIQWAVAATLLADGTLGVVDPTLQGALAATLSGDATVTSDLAGQYPLVVTFAGSGDFVATILQNPLFASLDASADLTAVPTMVLSPSAILIGDASVTSALNVFVGPVTALRYGVPSRRAEASKVVFDQLDLFLADGKTRAQDVPVSALYLRVYVNGTQADWPLVSGAGVTDVQIAAGKVYWTEFSTGFYSVRFFPNQIGIWRVILTYPIYDQAVSLSYDVVPQVGFPGGLGLRSSFIG